MEDLEASYNEMLTDDRAGGDCHKTVLKIKKKYKFGIKIGNENNIPT